MLVNSEVILESKSVIARVFWKICSSRKQNSKLNIKQFLNKVIQEGKAKISIFNM